MCLNDFVLVRSRNRVAQDDSPWESGFSLLGAPFLDFGRRFDQKEGRIVQNHAGLKRWAVT
jgi:hypothetical protein